MTSVLSHSLGKLKLNIEFNAALSQANFQSPCIFQYLTLCLDTGLFLILTSDIWFFSNALFSDSYHTLYNRRIHTFPPSILVLPGTKAQHPVPEPCTHTPLGGVGCPCPRPPLLWCSSNLGSGSCENSCLRAVKSHEKPHHRHSFFAQEHHLSWAFAFYLLSYAAALLCPTTSLVGPDLLACLPGQASHPPRRCGTSLVIVDCGWPWFLSPDLLCFSCLSTRDCVPGQWVHCPCLCCGHPQLLTCLPLRRWLPLLLPHVVFFAHSESGKHVSFLWSQHNKKKQ